MSIETQFIIIFLLGIFIGRYLRNIFSMWAIMWAFKFIKKNPESFNESIEKAKGKNRFQNKLADMMKQDEEQKTP